ncbi:MAG: box helicase domain protein, partial [Eubacterium sp.]|nr:box helicase domain protein [Eubacterium sp.]
MEQTFEKMSLNKSLVEALKLAEITVPTEIQQLVIPAAQKDKDLIFQSETGTGKTLAYMLPLFEKLETEKKEMQAIVLVPTHELAIQVTRVIEMLSLNSDLKATSTPIIGDVNITRQVDKLRTKPHIIVGTAGRILELIQKKKISAHTIKTIIIDEADRLLDDNNIEGIKAVIKTTLKERQLVMCSASMSPRTIERAKQLMKEPQVIKSKTAIEVPETIDHIYFVAEQREKVEVLRKLVRIINPPKAIAFFANAEDILEATEKLKFHKLRADGLHGSNIKSDRKKTMDDFKSGRLQLLVASDIAARGLDIEGVTHIFNVNITERSMDYLHRAGRTGRNGNQGMAISIVTEQEIPYIKQFEKELRISIIPKSMYNGVIVEYRKEKKKFDTTSEYTSPKARRDNKAVSKEEADGDKPSKEHSRDDRYVKKTDRDSRPERKYKPHDKDKTASRFKNNDRDAKSYDRDGKKPAFGGTKFKIGGKADGKYSRDERPGSRFKKDGENAGPKYGRDEKSGSRFKKDGDKSGFKFGRDEKPGSKFKKDGEKSGSKFGRDEKPGSRFKKDGEKSGSKFGRDEKPGSKFKKDGDKFGSKFGRDEKP